MRSHALGVALELDRSSVCSLAHAHTHWHRRRLPVWGAGRTDLRTRRHVAGLLPDRSEYHPVRVRARLHQPHHGRGLAHVAVLRPRRRRLRRGGTQGSLDREEQWAEPSVLPV